MGALQILIGLVISKIEEVHDYIQIDLSDGTTLSIFSNYVYDGGSALSIKDSKIQFVEEFGGGIIILFDNGRSISVGLNHDDYNGPEAMVLRQEGKSPVVWN